MTGNVAYVPKPQREVPEGPRTPVLLDASYILVANLARREMGLERLDDQ